MYPLGSRCLRRYKGKSQTKSQTGKSEIEPQHFAAYPPSHWCPGGGGWGLVFHSHRYGFNTLIRGKVPDEQLRRVTGHKTLAMTDTYDKPGVEHLEDVSRAQENLFRL